MNINNFLDKDNINTLWDVISDEDIFKFLSRDIQSNVAELFTKNIKGFFEVEKLKTNNLIDMNKKYIMLILNNIKNNYTQQLPNKIKILDESPMKELITYEEIQNDKKSQFEKDFQQRQQEFENIMTVKTPPVPEFSDKYADTPIKEMDKIIKQMTSSRNYDIEQINKTVNYDENWLKPQETSIKTEKNVFKEETQLLGNNSRLRYLTNENQDVFNSSNKKSVTWESDTEESIFKKLKKVPAVTDNININFEEFNNNNDNESTEYKITVLQREVKTLHSKLDMIIELLKQNK